MVPRPRCLIQLPDFVDPDNLLCDKKLQAPEVTIPYAERFEVRDGVIEMLRA